MSPGNPGHTTARDRSIKMKVWYQTYNVGADVDPRWRYYEDQCKRYIPKVARPGTEFHFVTAAKRAPKMVHSSYIQYLHVGQVIDSAVEAERKGFDVFILGGMRDLGYEQIKDAVDIPVAFIGEASYKLACLFADTFAVIHNDEASLHATAPLIKKYGLAAHAVPGVHLGRSHEDLIAAFVNRPEQMIEEIKAAARPAIKNGAQIFVTDFASTSIFLAEHGVRDIDGVPVLDSQAAVIKVAEMGVDFRKLGMPKAKPPLNDVTREDIQKARRVYGLQ
jgi:allantoin racemase